jgi:hypothetical protein
MENLQYAGKTVTIKFKLHTFESKSRPLSRPDADMPDKTRAQSVKKYISTKDDILPVRLDFQLIADGRLHRSCLEKNCRCGLGYSVSVCLL